jgi:alkylation response protein AidB-like acyl-CoA dehydrogenase
VAGGYQLSGHWKIVSGVNVADWILLGAIIDDGIPPRLAETGLPGFRQLAVPAALGGASPRRPGWPGGRSSG